METHRVRLAAWQQQVIAKANFVEYERDRLLPPRPKNDDPVYAATDVPLKAARHAAGVQKNGEPLKSRPMIGRPANWLANGWTGGPIKGAFVHLHLAMVGLVDLYTEDEIKAHSPGVLARMQHCLAPTDRRRQEAETLFGTGAGGASTGTTVRKHSTAVIRGAVSSGGDGNGAAAELCRRRAAFREAMKISYEAADEQHARVRSLRNTLIIAAALLTVLVGVMCIAGLRFPDAIPLCFEPSACPSTEGPGPQPGDVPIVALMGILGGAMSATFAIQMLRTTPTPTSKDLKVSLAFLKLPAGALTAIGGLILIHGQFIPGLTDLDSQGQILAYAIVLGVAQQLVTRFIDQKAEDVLAAVPSKGRRPMSAQGLDTETQATGQETPALTNTA